MRSSLNTSRDPSRVCCAAPVGARGPHLRIGCTPSCGGPAGVFLWNPVAVCVRTRVLRVDALTDLASLTNLVCQVDDLLPKGEGNSSSPREADSTEKSPHRRAEGASPKVTSAEEGGGYKPH